MFDVVILHDFQFGDALLGNGIYDKALYLYQNAVNLVSEVDDDYRIDSLVIVITCLCNMCTCFLSLGDVANAERMAKQAYDISPTYDKCAISMATVLVAQNKLEEAIVLNMTVYLHIEIHSTCSEGETRFESIDCYS